jgi:hypothetical protein
VTSGPILPPTGPAQGVPFVTRLASTWLLQALVAQAVGRDLDRVEVVRRIGPSEAGAEVAAIVSSAA